MTLTLNNRGRYGYEWHGNDTTGISGWLPAYSPVSSAPWPTANLAIYVPIRVLRSQVVKKLWFASFTTGTGNVDIGIYDALGTKLVSSGSTAKVATVLEQVFDVTDTTLMPGLVYMALVCSNNTDTFYGLGPAAPNHAAAGILTQASALPLPATATWAIGQTLTFVPMMGMLFGTLVA